MDTSLSEILHQTVGRLAENGLRSGHLSQEEVNTYWRDIERLRAEREERMGPVLQFVQEDLEMHGPLKGEEAEAYFKRLGDSKVPAYDKLAMTLAGMYRLGAALVPEDKQKDMGACWDAARENLNLLLEKLGSADFGEAVERLHDLLSENS